MKAVPEMGWQGLTNGELLALAEARFDVFVTFDKNLEYQQNLAKLRLGILVPLVPDNKILPTSRFLPVCRKQPKRFTPAKWFTLPPLERMALKSGERLEA